MMPYHHQNKPIASSTSVMAHKSQYNSTLRLNFIHHQEKNFLFLYQYKLNISFSFSLYLHFSTSYCRQQFFLILLTDSKTVTATHKQLTFSGGTYLSKKGVMFLRLPQLQNLQISFLIFFFKNWLVLECFYYNIDMLILDQTLLYFSSNNYDLK